MHSILLLQRKLGKPHYAAVQAAGKKEFVSELLAEIPPVLLIRLLEVFFFFVVMSVLMIQIPQYRFELKASSCSSRH